MLAVVEIQGKQYIITDTTTSLETDSFRDGKVGDKIVVDKVLLYQEKEDSETVFGTPYIEGKSFELEITSQEKGKKVFGIKFKRRKRMLKRVNHRQMKAKLSIKGSEKSPKKVPVKKVEAKKTVVRKVPAKKKKD